MERRTLALGRCGGTKLHETRQKTLASEQYLDARRFVIQWPPWIAALRPLPDVSVLPRKLATPSDAPVSGSETQSEQNRGTSPERETSAPGTWWLRR